MHTLAELDSSFENVMDLMKEVKMQYERMVMANLDMDKLEDCHGHVVIVRGQLEQAHEKHMALIYQLDAWYDKKMSETAQE
jgi:hypothetical protein